MSFPPFKFAANPVSANSNRENFLSDVPPVERCLAFNTANTLVLVAISHQFNGDANRRKIREILVSVPSVIAFFRSTNLIGATQPQAPIYCGAKEPVAPLLLIVERLLL